MSKYRCPVCGATHRDMPDACRLCGQKMAEGAVVGDFSGSRDVIAKRKGLGGMVAIAILIVVVIAVGLAWAGIGPGGRQVDQVIAQAPIPLKARADGWSELREEEGRFIVDMPTNGRERVTPEQKFFGAESTEVAWVVKLGSDTLIEARFLDLPEAMYAEAFPGGTIPADGGRAFIRTLTENMVAEQIAAGGKVVRNEDSAFAGVASQRVELRNVTSPELKKSDLHVEAVYFLVGKRLYVLSTESIYTKDRSDQFTPLVQNFQLINASTPPADTTPSQ